MKNEEEEEEVRQTRDCEVGREEDSRQEVREAKNGLGRQGEVENK